MSATIRRIGLGLLLLLAVGCDPALPGKPNPKDRPIPPERVTSFTALFGRNCAGCHGQNGTIGPAPPLNEPLFRSLIPLAELEKVITHGRPGTPMPPFAQQQGGTLTTTQIQILAHEIKGVPYRLHAQLVDGKERLAVVADPKGIVPQWGIVPAAPSTLPPYLLPKDVGDVPRGAKLFARACANCHGDDGQGYDDGDKIQNRLHDPAFLSLISDQALRRIILTGRPDLKMPNCTEKNGRPDDYRMLTSEEIADIGALLGAWRKETK